MKAVIAFMLLAFIAFSGCAAQQEQAQTITADLKIYGSGNEVALEKTLSAKEGATLFQALKDNNVPFEFEDSGYGAFITGIAGINPTEQQYLAIYVNEEYAQEGISTLKLQKGMKIEFKIEQIDPNYGLN